MTQAGTRVRLPFEPELCGRCGMPISGPPGTPCHRPECTVAAALEEVRSRRLRRVRLGRQLLRAEGMDPDTTSWSPTPFQPAPQVPVPAAERARFRARLEAVIAAARGPGEAPDDAAGPAPAPEEPRFRAGGAVFAAACAACGGLCCRQGLPRSAFLEPADLRRVAASRPEMSDADLVGLYLSHLGPTHAERSCLFHGERGCRLPREIRSTTCNAWICQDIEDLFLDTGGGDGVPSDHVFVALSRDGRQGGRVVRYRANAASKADADGGKSRART